MTDLVVLMTTVGSHDDALRLARAAVEVRVAACVQVIGPITSVYRWEGAIEETDEFLLLMKAPSDRIDLLTAFVRERHTYDTPELTAVESTFVDDRYLAWAAAETIG